MAKTKQRKKVNRNKTCPVTSFVQKCISLQVDWKDPNPYESCEDRLFDFKYSHKNPIIDSMIMGFVNKNHNILMYHFELNWVCDIEAHFEDSNGKTWVNGYRHTNHEHIDGMRHALEIIAHKSISEGGDFEDFKYVRIRMLCLGWEDYTWPEDYEINDEIHDDVITCEIRKYINEIYSDDKAIEKRETKLIGNFSR